MNWKSEHYKAPLISILSMTAVQIEFYLIAILGLYFIITVNWTVIIICLVLVIVQAPFRGRNQKYVDWIVKYFKPNYFCDIKRVYQEEIPDDEKTLFCFSPHSVFCLGLLLNMNHPDFRNSKLSNSVTLGSQFALSIPLFGLHLKWWGIESASASNFKRLLKTGRPISLIPGGYEQATLTSPHEIRAYVKQRFGFIKYALQNNYTIRPVIVMNEHRAMQTFDYFKNIRLLFNKIKMPGVIYWGKYGIFYPPGIKATTVIGKGIKGRQYAQEEKATDEEVHKYHARYIEELKQLYEKHKDKNGNVPMKIY